MISFKIFADDVARVGWSLLNKGFRVKFQTEQSSLSVTKEIGEQSVSDIRNEILEVPGVENYIWLEGGFISSNAE